MLKYFNISAKFYSYNLPMSKTKAISNHGLAITGGTFTMGYVTGAFLKRLSSEEYHSLKDEEYYLYPLFDIRHIALAAYVDESSLLNEQKIPLYESLVETQQTIQELLLAKKEHPGSAPALEKKLDAALNGIATRIQPNLTADAALKHYGLSRDQIDTPYFIDSINYDEHTHDEKLYACAKNALLGKKNQTYFVIGGTDSLVMYAGKLTRRLIDEGLIGKENSNKVIFLSAMKSFGYGPEGVRETPESVVEHWKKNQGAPRAFLPEFEPPVAPHVTMHPQYIGRLLHKAMQLATPYAKSLPAGGYIFSPTNEECHSIGLHDARETAKVYCHWVDAFRSKSWYAAIMEEKNPLKINPKYKPVLKATSVPGERVEYVKIAPPLINGNSTGAVLNYLQATYDLPVIIVGGIPTLGTPPSIDHAVNYQAIETIEAATPAIPLEKTKRILTTILDVIRERAERGVPTYWVNPDVYDINKTAFYPLIPTKTWEKNEMVGKVKQAGGIALSGNTLIGAYHEIQRQLGKCVPIQGIEKIRALGGTPERPLNDNHKTHIPMAKGDPIGIEYTPDREAFAEGMKIAAGLRKNVVLSVLPGSVLPGYVAPLVAENPKNRFIATYQYGHEQRRWLQFIQKPEWTQPPSFVSPTLVAASTYAPALAFITAGGHTGGDYSPAELMNSLQKHADLDPMLQYLLRGEMSPRRHFARNIRGGQQGPRTPGS